MNKFHAQLAKAFTLMAFRNGPLEDIHAGKTCPVCAGDEDYSHLSQEDMKALMRHGVEIMYTLLRIRDEAPKTFVALVGNALAVTTEWDDPTDATLRTWRGLLAEEHL